MRWLHIDTNVRSLRIERWIPRGHAQRLQSNEGLRLYRQPHRKLAIVTCTELRRKATKHIKNEARCHVGNTRGPPHTPVQHAPVGEILRNRPGLRGVRW